MRRRIAVLVLLSGTVTALYSAPADATTCTTDASLPAPVAATVVDGLGTVQGTIEGQAGPLPVDVAGTVGAQLGCTSGTTDPGVDPTLGDGVTTSPVVDTNLPVAGPAAPVAAGVAFTG